VIDHWDLAGRDVVPDLSARGQVGDVGAAVLYGLLASDGQNFVQPYENVRAALRIRKKQVLPELEEQANERIRTYKVLFRGLGLLYDQDGILHSTEFGRELLATLESQYTTADDYARGLFLSQRRKLAQLAIEPLSRYQLVNPFTTAEYPPGTDIHPLRAIWYVMRNLGDKLHWEEMGRALTPCLRETDLPAVVERIKAARSDANYDPRNQDQMTQLLGPRMPDMGNNQSDRLDTWYSRAAFKNLFLEARDRGDGYRYLNAEFADLIDAALAASPEFNASQDAQEYMQWFGTVDSAATEPDTTQRDISLRVVERCRRFGDRQIVALVGPAGTGKTSCAWEAASILTGGDATCVVTIQFHAGFTYEEFVAGLAPDGHGGFEPKLGALLGINKRAHEEPDKLFVLVIDELSRADVANVLGELLTYIEYRDRYFHVPILGHAVSIASNLVVIATLNPADRSVVNMDDALVRRLRQVDVPRSTLALRSILSAAGTDPELVDSVARWFEGLPADAPFGHGLFVGVKDASDLHSLWYESLQYFLRRGGLLVHADAEAIERGYIWRQPQFASDPEPTASSNEDQPDEEMPS
jgi:hypothetical protein